MSHPPATVLSACILSCFCEEVWKGTAGQEVHKAPHARVPRA